MPRASFAVDGATLTATPVALDVDTCNVASAEYEDSSSAGTMCPNDTAPPDIAR